MPRRTIREYPLGIAQCPLGATQEHSRLLLVERPLLACRHPNMVLAPAPHEAPTSRARLCGDHPSTSAAHDRRRRAHARVHASVRRRAGTCRWRSTAAVMSITFSFAETTVAFS